MFKQVCHEGGLSKTRQIELMLEWWFLQRGVKVPKANPPAPDRGLEELLVEQPPSSAKPSGRSRREKGGAA